MSEGRTGDDARVGTGWAPTVQVISALRPGAAGDRRRRTARGERRRPGHSASDRSASRLWWWVGGAATVTLAVVVGLVTNQDPPPAPDPEIVVLPVPTATVDPIDRGDTTALVAAMPGTVLEFALADVAEDKSLLEAGALEAWRLAYDDGSGREVVVQVGQWAAPEGASAAMADLLAEAGSTGGPASAGDPASSEGADASTGPGPLPPSGPVEVGGEQVGEYRILAVDAAAERTVAIWTNGTVLLRAEGPAAAFPNFYAAFPL